MTPDIPRITPPQRGPSENMGLTSNQRALLVFICEHIDEKAYPPTYDQMVEAMGLASKSGIHRLLQALEERGYIRRMKARARAIEVLVRPQTKMADDVERLRRENAILRGALQAIGIDVPPVSP